MTTRERLDGILETLSEDQLQEVTDFAQFLAWREERTDWQRFGRNQLARAYGPDEPEYTEADLKPELDE